MSIQTLRGSCINGKLALSWIIMKDSTKAVAIQIARDSEFTEDLHMYILPPISQCMMDTGKGVWFFRAGACEDKKIEWSGIPPEVYVDTEKQPELLKKTFFNVMHTQMITGGIRLHTDTCTVAYAIIEYSQNPNFTASSTKTLYWEDAGRGYFEGAGLDPTHTYHVRITSTNTPFASLPKDTIHVMQLWQTFSGKKALPPLKPTSLTHQAELKRYASVLREANESKKPMRFASGQEYAMFLSAKTASQGQKS